MNTDWKNLVLGFAALLATLAVVACASPPRDTASTGLSDPSSINNQSVPYEAWFKDRPQ